MLRAVLLVWMAYEEYAIFSQFHLHYMNGAIAWWLIFHTIARLSFWNVILPLASISIVGSLNKKAGTK